jgi:hypothetical protein
MNFIKKNLTNYSSEMNLTTSSLLKMIDKSINFIEMILVKSEYFNKQTLNIVLKYQV